MKPISESQHPFLRGLRAPLHSAHRGGAGLYPENTMFAFTRAVELHRTDLLELDVHASRDGEVVVAHDPTLERCTDGTGALADLTWAQLSKLDAGFHTKFRGHGVALPRLLEVLNAFPSLRINVEVKVEGAIEPFVALVKKEGAIDRLCIGSESDAIAAELVKRLPGGCFFYPANALAAFVLPTKAGEKPEDDGRFTVLDMPYHWEGVQLFDANLAQIAREHGKWINVWTVDDADDMRRAIADGVGGIMTDRPDVLREVLG
ncbi:MAG: glycerophosphodiester phosphodiesterase [Archangium sp.]